MPSREWPRGKARRGGSAAHGDIQAFDIRRWMGRNDVPSTSLMGTVQGSMTGTRDSTGLLLVSTAQGDVTLLQREAEERPEFDLLASARTRFATVAHRFRDGARGRYHARRARRIGPSGAAGCGRWRRGGGHH